MDAMGLGGEVAIAGTNDDSAMLSPLAMEQNVGVIARVPFDEGSLTGAITESTTFQGREFRAFYFRGDRKKQVAEHIGPLRRDLGVEANLADVALRFCLSHPAVSSVIPGMRTRRHAESNTSLSDMGSLPPETLAILKRHAWNRNFYS